MTDREKMIELIRDGRACPIDRNPFDDETCKSCKYLPDVDCDITRLADHLLANGVTFAKDMNVPSKKPRPLEEWGEDYGDVLWWAFPIEEPPYVGSPLDEKWPGYHTHWTPFAVPEEGC